MSKIPRVCGECRYWDSYQSGIKGTCHRFPPQVYCDGEGSYKEFPEVWDHEWCGEFKANEDEAKVKHRKGKKA